MGFLSGLFKTTVFAIGTLVDIAANAVGYVAAKVRTAYETYRNQHGRADVSEQRRSSAKQIYSINNEIVDLEQKRRYDRRLSSSDSERLQELYKQRNAQAEVLHGSREIVLDHDISESVHQYDSVQVESANIHVLLYHVGQTVLGKRCSSCGNPMELQWRSGTGPNPEFKDFFWGCVAWHDNKSLKHRQPFVQRDLALFTRVDRPEFEVSSVQLNSILDAPGARNNVRRRMNEAKNEETDVYLCPVHQEPMILREKKDADGLLNQYFMSCPRFMNQACNQIVKLKSAAQLASVLEAFHGRGIF